jgi:cell division protein FtsW
VSGFSPASWLDRWHNWRQGQRDKKAHGQVSVRLGKNAYSSMPARRVRDLGYDQRLVWVTVALLLWGCIMVYSTTLALPSSPQFANYAPTHFISRHVFSVLLSLVGSWFLVQVPMSFWQKWSWQIFLFAIALLIAVLLIGKGVKGARRWLPLGFMNFQPSELTKLAIIFFIAGYIEKNDALVKQNFWKAVWPIAVAVLLVGILLMLEPDMGAFMVIAVIAMCLLLLGGINWKVFALILSLLILAFATIVFTSEWRRERVFAYINPWDMKYALGKGYQLTQSLIAIGRGGWTGVGLGGSVEKLHWLPEAHTDFIMAIIAEELGFIGVLCLIALFFWLIKRVILIGRQAIELENYFSGLVAQGVGLWLAFQVMINMGVNLGVLPTKGLTLPLMSYGGSAILMTVLSLSVVLRVDYENRTLMNGVAR